MILRAPSTFYLPAHQTKGLGLQPHIHKIRREPVLHRVRSSDLSCSSTSPGQVFSRDGVLIEFRQGGVGRIFRVRLSA
jgi:hypothetical protein